VTRKRNDVKPVRKPNSKSKAEIKGKQVQRRCEQQGDVRLVFAPTGEPSEEAVRSVIKDWVAPRLVEEFLRQRGLTDKVPNLKVVSSPKSPTTGSLVRSNGS